jgi:hypothetical protein
VSDKLPTMWDLISNDLNRPIPDPLPHERPWWRYFERYIDLAYTLDREPYELCPRPDPPPFGLAPHRYDRRCLCPRCISFECRPIGHDYVFTGNLWAPPDAFGLYAGIARASQPWSSYRVPAPRFEWEGWDVDRDRATYFARFNVTMPSWAGPGLS